MIEYMYWVSLPYATFGLFSRDDKTIHDAAPIAKWCIGKQRSFVIRYYVKKGATIYERDAKEVWSQIAS